MYYEAEEVTECARASVRDWREVAVMETGAWRMAVLLAVRGKALLSALMTNPDLDDSRLV